MNRYEADYRTYVRSIARELAAYKGEGCDYDGITRGKLRLVRKSIGSVRVSNPDGSFEDERAPLDALQIGCISRSGEEGDSRSLLIGEIAMNLGGHVARASKINRYSTGAIGRAVVVVASVPACSGFGTPRESQRLSDQRR